MGFAKRYYEEMTAGGLNLHAVKGKYVCANCIDDSAIQSFIQAHAQEQSCSFCGNEAPEPIAAPLVDVVQRIDTCLCLEYDDPANVLMYDGREGGYQGTIWDTNELLQDVGLELPNDDDGSLFDLICESFDNREWCESDPSGISTHGLIYSWNEFCEVIQHKRRFFFLTAKTDDYGLLNPAEILEELAKYCTTLGLVRTLPKGSQIIRVRAQRAGESIQGALALGPPPEHLALQSNRMSPPGISLLYAAREENTALAETADGAGDFAVGTFVLERDARILDLTQVPHVPTLFDLERANLRAPIRFLRAFVKDASKPIARDERIHIEYVPTQVVTEYFREYFRDENGGLDGITYPSSRTRGTSYVLFAGPRDICVDKSDLDHLSPVQRALWPRKDAWLRLVAQQVRTLTG